jgi:hypothetical protein
LTNRAWPAVLGHLRDDLTRGVTWACGMLYQVFADPLRASTNLFPDEESKARFLAIVFRRIDAIVPVHARLSAALRARQAEAALVDHVLDVLDEAVRSLRRRAHGRGPWRGGVLCENGAHVGSEGAPGATCHR